MRAARALIALLAVVQLFTAAVGLSGATHTSHSTNPDSTFSAATDWAPPSVRVNDLAQDVRGTVTVSVSATDEGGLGVASVRIQRSLSGQGQWVDVCVDSEAPYACALDTTTLTNELYDLRAVAIDRAGFTATSEIVDVGVDNRAPTVSVTDPGSTLRGVVTVAASAADAESGIGHVTVQRRTESTGAWTDLCTDAAAPYSCRWDTTTSATPDGQYELRAIAVDLAENTTTSSAVGVRLDNSISTVSLEDPGAHLRGTVTLNANASSTAGVKSVAIQRSPAGAKSWTTICTDDTSPYFCVLDTATPATPDGLYDLRAVMTKATTGPTIVSDVLADRRIDNAPVRGADVQALNRAGGTAGRIESGDALTLTWSNVMSPPTLVPSWDGKSPVTVYARLRDGGALGTGSASDWLELWGNATATQSIGVGAVGLGGDFVRSNKTVTFTATMTLGAATVNALPATTATIVLGTPSGGGVRTNPATGSLSWTPSAQATDLTGLHCSTAPVAESGVADRDF